MSTRPAPLTSASADLFYSLVPSPLYVLRWQYRMQQIQIGMNYTMFNKQFRMTAGLEELPSRLCYDERLQNVDATLLVNRLQLPSRHFVHPEGVGCDYGSFAFLFKRTYGPLLKRKDEESQKPTKCCRRHVHQRICLVI